MHDPRIGTLLRRAARLFGQSGPATADAILLDRFAHHRDPAAFAELVARHGPGVWALCRRVTRTETDAEDVFQATFLVFARHAGRVRKAASVGSWLFGVAFRLGRKTRMNESRVPDPNRLTRPEAGPDPADTLTWCEVRAALTEELARLPDDLRAPLLLCYFDGRTQDEAAAELGWKTRTLKARVARGRDLLRTRLTRRGIELPAALSVPLVAAELAAVPTRLTADLATQAGNVAARRPPGGAISPAAAELARTGVPSMTSMRVLVLAACAAAGLLTAGAGVLIGRRDPVPVDPPAPTEKPAAPPVAQGEPPADPLPPGAVVRIGTNQFRQVGWHKRAFFTPDAKTVMLVGEGSPGIRFWDVETGRVVYEMPLNGGYHDAAFSPDSLTLAVVGSRQPGGKAGASETVLWLIDAATRTVTRTIPLPGNVGGNHQKVRFGAAGKRVIVEYEGDVRVFETKTGVELARHKGRINAGTVAVSPDGKLIAFGRNDVFLWRWEAGEEPKKFTTVSHFGTEVMQFAPDGKTLYIAEFGGERITTWDVITGRQTGTLAPGSMPWVLAFSPDGKTLAIPSLHNASVPPAGGHRVELWDVATGRETRRLPVGRLGVESVSWSADGTRLVAVSNYRVWVWEVATGKRLGPTGPGHEATIGALAFASDGRLFTASDDHTVRSWDPATGRPGLELVHAHWVRGLALSPDGALVAGSALRNDLQVWDAKTGEPRFKLLGNGYRGGIRRVQFSPDGKRLIAWGDDLYLRTWDTRTGKLLAEHRTIPTGMTAADLDDDRRMDMMLLGSTAAAISPDGKSFVLCSFKGVQLFDVATGVGRPIPQFPPGSLSQLAFSPDGSRLAVVGREKPVQAKLQDGRTRYLTDPGHSVLLWDLTMEKVVWEGSSEGSWSAEIHFTPDGTKVAKTAYGADKKHTLRFWDAATGKEAGRIPLPDTGGHFAFDQSGKRVAVSHNDTTAVVYDLARALQPDPPKK